ncbi:MAG: phage capsid protein, partial [Roseococcus sp.]
VNRLGCAGLGRLVAGAEPAEVVAATWVAAELFGLEARFEEAEAAPPEPRLAAQGVLRELLEAAAVELLLPARAGLSAAIASLGAGIATLTGAEMAGGEPGLGGFIAAAPRLAAAPSIVRLASETGAAPAEAARAWAEVGAAYQLDALAQAARRMAAGGSYGDRARAALLADLRATQSRLAAQRLAGGAEGLPDALRSVLVDAAMQGDFAAVTVAVRALAIL